VNAFQLDDFDLALVRLHQFLAAVQWTRANVLEVSQ